MKKIDHTGLRTWIEVDTKAIEHNVGVFRGLIPKKTKLCGVVKSNAYGHGLVETAKILEGAGVDFIAVDSIVEGFTLREEEITVPMFVLGYTLPEHFEAAIKHNISLAISTFESLDILVSNKKYKGIKVHIKIDTGMHRQGFLLKDQKRLLEFLKKHTDQIIVEGLFTHFAAAKNPDESNDTVDQIDVFEQWILAFNKEKIACIMHAAATGGALLYPQAHYDMVRIGIGMYGIWPSDEVREISKKEVKLQPALVWKSLISEIKEIPAGERIGYDYTAELHRDSKIAIVPVGYWHGFPRSLSNTGSVVVNGREAHVLGRVSMDMLIIDVTGIDLQVGDTVTLLGGGSPLLDPEYVGPLADSSAYELLTRLNPRMQRFYI